MPRIARNVEEVDQVKEQILDEASKLILDEGFKGFSMRKLAGKLGMTAANIYNYFLNKDEIYLSIQTRGFEMMYEFLLVARDEASSPRKRLQKFIEGYIWFGLKRSNYYEVIFSRNTPKYTDYKGTQLEPVAFTEKAAGLRVLDLASQTIAQALGRVEDDEYCRQKAIEAWIFLHGLVSLYQTRVLQEVCADVDAVVQRISVRLMDFIGARD